MKFPVNEEDFIDVLIDKDRNAARRYLTMQYGMTRAVKEKYLIYADEKKITELIKSRYFDAYTRYFDLTLDYIKKAIEIRGKGKDKSKFVGTFQYIIQRYAELFDKDVCNFFYNENGFYQSHLMANIYKISDNEYLEFCKGGKIIEYSSNSRYLKLIFKETCKKYTFSEIFTMPLKLSEKEIYFIEKCETDKLSEQDLKLFVNSGLYSGESLKYLLMHQDIPKAFAETFYKDYKYICLSKMNLDYLFIKNVIDTDEIIQDAAAYKNILENQKTSKKYLVPIYDDALRRKGTLPDNMPISNKILLSI